MPLGRNRVVAVYNCRVLRGLGDNEETQLSTLRAAITKAEQQGWELVEIFRYSCEPTAFMRKPEK